MSFIDPKKKEITFKVVYYGPARSGKTTTLKALQAKIKAPKKTAVVKVADDDRTIFFDFLGLSSDKIAGYKTRFQVYTVPGQPLYENSRRVLLKGVDGVIFVADSTLERFSENLTALEELKNILADQSLAMGEFPFVFQYNKRDLTDSLPFPEMKKVLNQVGALDVESVASKGEGVLEAFQACAKQVVKSLQK